MRFSYFGFAAVELIILYRPDALPDAQPTASKSRRQVSADVNSWHVTVTRGYPLPLNQVTSGSVQ